MEDVSKRKKEIWQSIVYLVVWAVVGSFKAFLLRWLPKNQNAIRVAINNWIYWHTLGFSTFVRNGKKYEHTKNASKTAWEIWRNGSMWPKDFERPLTVIAINRKDLHNIHIFSVVHVLISFVYIFRTVSFGNSALLLARATYTQRILKHLRCKNLSLAKLQ